LWWWESDNRRCRRFSQCNNPAMPDIDVGAVVDRWTGGDRAALDEMLPAIYGELRRLAALYLSRERPGHTLQPTALVHETYLNLIQQRQVDWRNRRAVSGRGGRGHAARAAASRRASRCAKARRRA
jgi:hypothetical protein